VFCKYLALCLCICVYIFVCKYFSSKKKNIFLCTLRSNVSCTFEHVHCAANELTFVCLTAAPHHTHSTLHACVRTYLRTFERMTHLTPMHPAGVRLNVLMYVRTYSFLGLT
jgi:hypothetical protein